MKTPISNLTFQATIELNLKPDEIQSVKLVGRDLHITTTNSTKRTWTLPAHVEPTEPEEQKAPENPAKPAPKKPAANSVNTRKVKQ